MRLPSFLSRLRWKQLITRWFNKPSSPLTTLYKNLDLRLVNHVRSGGVPSWAQMRHLSEFLSAQEKKYLRIFSLIITLLSLVIVVNYLWANHTVKPARGGEYTEGIIGTPSLINPLFSSFNPVDADLTKLIYSGLFRFDENLTLQTALAERYEIDKNGKNYRIFLKKNLKWSDGEPLTADDIGFTIERIQDTDAHSPLILLFQNVSFDKINDQEFTLTLKDAYAPFINFLTAGIIPQHIWQEITPANTRLSTTNLKPVGSGPYMVQTLSKDETGVIRSYTLRPNDNFSGDAAFIKKLTFKFFTDFTSAFDALKTRQINGLGHIPLADIEKINTKTNSLFSFDTSQYTALFFNPSNQPILKDKKIRAALLNALNRAALIQNIFGVHANPINGPLLEELFDFNPATDTASLYNIQSANQLFADAGWKKISLDERAQGNQENQINAWIKKNPQPTLKRRATAKQKAAFEEQFAAWQKHKEEARAKIAEETQKAAPPNQSFFLQKNNTIMALTITVPRQDEYQKAADMIAEAWRAVGIEVRIETVEPNRMRADVLKDKKYDVLLYSVILSNDGDPYPLWHSSQIKSGGLNLSVFSNKQTDNLLVKARSSTSFDDRRALYQKFQAILDEEIPAIFLYSQRYMYAMQSDVRGVPQTRLYANDDRFNTISAWFIKTRWGLKK
ncbi:MAG: peptide ABC transporter substrate-binding protein [Candidatus Magasanikbacteria bacterium]|nr:peptide ABC transporter substrate-binding protein [Candidatus Magasanikbacteria bacterium]